MNYQDYSQLRGEAREAFDAIEDWMADAFGKNRDTFVGEFDEEYQEPLKRGMRYFAAGRSKDRRMFASWLFPKFQGDVNETRYREALVDILRVAGSSVAPKTRHKLSFDLGVLYFTADGGGNMLGVVASEDFPMAQAFKFLQEMLDIYDGVDISALDKADAVWKDERFRNDAFGVRDLAIAAWKRYARKEDGHAKDMNDQFAF